MLAGTFGLVGCAIAFISVGCTAFERIANVGIWAIGTKKTWPDALMDGGGYLLKDANGLGCHWSCERK
jgi:hypothetical protein